MCKWIPQNSSEEKKESEGVGDRLNRLVLIWVDAGYQGEGFMKWMMDTYRWIFEVVCRPTDAKGFVLLPRRWVVERSNGRVQLVSSFE